MNKNIIHLFQKEIGRYLNIPYASNRWLSFVLTKEAIFAGKGTWQEIDYATKCAAEKEKLSLSRLSSKEIYALQKRNRIGIDCSGLAYHLLNKLHQLHGHSGILYQVLGNKKSFGIYGVRSVSADALTDTKNSQKILDYNQVQTGDLIRFDGGKHVIVIVDQTDNCLKYVHSSQKTKIRGVHFGHITLVDPQKTLDHQKWSDITSTGTNYAKMFFPKKGDGIFRLKCFSSSSLRA